MCVSVRVRAPCQIDQLGPSQKYLINLIGTMCSCRRLSRSLKRKAKGREKNGRKWENGNFGGGGGRQRLWRKMNSLKLPSNNPGLLTKLIAIFVVECDGTRIACSRLTFTFIYVVIRCVRTRTLERWKSLKSEKHAEYDWLFAMTANWCRGGTLTWTFNQKKYWFFSSVVIIALTNQNVIKMRDNVAISYAL